MRVDSIAALGWRHSCCCTNRAANAKSVHHWLSTMSTRRDQQRGWFQPSAAAVSAEPVATADRVKLQLPSSSSGSSSAAEARRKLGWPEAAGSANKSSTLTAREWMNAEVQGAAISRDQSPSPSPPTPSPPPSPPCLIASTHYSADIAPIGWFRGATPSPPPSPPLPIDPRDADSVPTGWLQGAAESQKQYCALPIKTLMDRAKEERGMTDGAKRELDQIVAVYFVISQAGCLFSRFPHSHLCLQLCFLCCLLLERN